MIRYMTKHYDKLLGLLAEHMWMSAAAVGIAFAIAFAAAMLMYRRKEFALPVNVLCNTVYAIPTLALFSILIPITGLGKTTAIVTMVLYNQFILTKSICSAFETIDQSVLEAADAIGLDGWQTYCSVKAPLALPLMLNGVKLALSSTVAGATLAALIGAGGLGELIFNGLSMKNYNQVAWGVVLSSLCAFAANHVMQWMEDRALDRIQG
ncbi:MAG: ABC transporter permease [Clostridiales Family XIII bacterium]|jgi:osmoprotectant transport system permease protein|nr:ABC transporter permease [Clostridiales Family XIII bacterium]